MAKEELNKEKNCFSKKQIIITLTFVGILLAIVAVRTYFFDYYLVPSASMETTIMTGECVIGDKNYYRNNSPEYKDIVIFNDPTDSGNFLIKRVIATEKQTVDIKNGSVYIDNQKLDEDYVNEQSTNKLSDSNINFPLTVPEGKMFVMGDNRNNSADSRAFGCVSVDSINAKGISIIFPFNKIHSLN